MKKLLVLILFALPAMAQTKIVLAADSSYASTVTTAWVNISPTDAYAFGIFFKDSVNVSIRLDYRGVGAPGTVYQSYNIEADSTNSTTATGYFKGVALRGDTDNMPSAEQIRLVVTRKTTKNGTTTPTFDAWLWRY